VIRAAIDHAGTHAVASVVHVVENGAVALTQVNRGQDLEVGRELDVPLSVSRGELEIHDLLVVLVVPGFKNP